MNLKHNRIKGMGAICAAMLIAGASAYAGDATLNRLEIKLDGNNILSTFNKNTFEYSLELGENAATMATFSAAPSDKESTIDINVNGVNYYNNSVGSLMGGENVIK